MPSWEELGKCATLVNTSGMDPREYQLNIAKSIFTGKNTLVILPTGLGKTLIAIFAIANALYNGKKAIILAPTKPLSEQHHKSLETLLNIDKKGILLLTGSISGKNRAGLEANARVIAATPQTISNDLKAGRFSLSDVGVVIFDECHRAVGRYAYMHVASECKENGVQVIGLTASPGSKKEKIDALITSLGIENIEIRVSADPDVERYVMSKSTETIWIEPGPRINAILATLKPTIDEHLGKLYSKGLSPYKYFEKMPKGRLLEIGDNIGKIKASGYRFSATYDYVFVLDLVHAYELAASEGIYPFLSYITTLRDREQKSRAVQSIISNKTLIAAEAIAREALDAGEEHPKMFEVVRLLTTDYKGKSAIVFAQYRSTIKKLTEMLNAAGVTAGAFVGKKEGVTIVHQQQAMQDFRDGKFRVLVATSIAEEGLDIPSVDLVVFYEPVASEIRNIQRKGRTGRIRFGEVVILVAKGTKDEAYLMIARIKEKRMRDTIMRIKESLAREGAKYAEERQHTLFA